MRILSEAAGILTTPNRAASLGVRFHRHGSSPLSHKSYRSMLLIVVLFNLRRGSYPPQTVLPALVFVFTTMGDLLFLNLVVFCGCVPLRVCNARLA